MARTTQTTKNTPPTLKVKLLEPTASLPTYATEGSAGLDLTIIEDALVYPFAPALKVRTGIALELPEGYFGKIYLRSSTGANTKIRLANGTGIIDNDYRGEITLLLENLSRSPFRLFKGERIAQLIIEQQDQINIKEVYELSDTARGTGGIGSTTKQKEGENNK